MFPKQNPNLKYSTRHSYCCKLLSTNRQNKAPTTFVPCSPYSQTNSQKSSWQQNSSRLARTKSWLQCTVFLSCLKNLLATRKSQGSHSKRLPWSIQHTKGFTCQIVRNLNQMSLLYLNVIVVGSCVIETFAAVPSLALSLSLSLNKKKQF
jgi:hypothetical protein